MNGEGYRTVLIDPPWLERGGGKTYKRGADRHYPLMGKHRMLRTIILCEHFASIAENSHMYLWVTNNFLADGLWLMGALHYRYVTNFCWAKKRIGLGQYFRGQHELCLFGTRGKKPTEPRTERKDLPSLICAAKSTHSKKPEESYQLIENRSKGPYLELFARRKRDGWTVWGNEA